MNCHALQLRCARGAAIGAFCAASSVLAGGPVAELSVETLTGTHSLVARGGDLISARVRFDAPVDVVFNAAMFRIVVTDGVAATQDSWHLESYDWHAPFVTHGPGDFSLNGLSTPLEVTPPTLQGNGLPIDTADIDFAVFDFFQYAGTGTTLDFSFRLPADAQVGRRYLVAAVPDQITWGFLDIPTDIGFIMDVLVGEPGQTPPTAVLNSVANTTCGLENGAIDISVAYAQSLSWIGPNGFTSTSEDLANLAPGTYSLQATGPGGTASLTAQVGATPDTTAPTVTSYTPSASAAASASCTAPVPDLRASVVATDNCTASSAIVVTQSPAPSTPCGIGTHQIQLTATDASGNATTVNAVFTVSGVARTYYADADVDGFGDPTAPATSCAGSAPSGTVTNSGDCDDRAQAVNPARPELCDGIDNDCSGLIDDGVVFSDFYTDADADGYGDHLDTAVNACLPPAGKVNNNLDCNDAEPLVRPSAIERCADIGVDNDCDGETNEVAPNAPDSLSFYRDLDGDQYGTMATTVRACDPPAGHVAAPGDCNDADARVNPGATETCNGVDDDCVQGIDNGLEFRDYFIDADADGFGRSGTAAVSACAPVAGRAANSTDCNDVDASIHPNASEACDGIDNNCDGAVDQGCTALTAYLTPSAMVVRPGETLRVRVSGTAPTHPLSAIRLALRFDASRLHLDSVAPAIGGPFTVETQESIDNAAGTLEYAASAAQGSQGMSTATDIAELMFTVLEAPTACGSSGLVSFGTVGSAVTSFTASSGATITPSVVDLPPVSLDGDAPVLTGVPSTTIVAVDAGITEGGTVPAPSVAATDGCDAAVTVAVVLAYPNGSTGASWPSGGLFPIGTTQVTFRAADAAGNAAVASCLVTVLDHQLLDVNLSYQGANIGNAPRAIRVKAGASTQVVPFAMVAGAATIEGIQVPVSAGYACISVKDTGFSLTSAAAPSVSARRYAANLTVVQGDSDDDDFIDITDFGFLFVDRGLQSPQSRSNFNADSVVNNADLGFISVNFFRGGDTCTPGADAPRAPRRRLHVKELRRIGLGELAAADLNHDGWVDTHDMQMAMQGGGAPQRADIPHEAGGGAW
jgi:hypothetical protein